MEQPNRLIAESSPYLRQHAHNPVDWYPWGEEALCRSRELDRPIFLSVGYSACHWCHVMERESFEDEEIARILNDHFVSIKVDREERPDIDAIYMNAVQIMTRHGGWPMSVFLSPDLRPFWGGTYFPPRSRFGQPGFRDVLLSLAKAYEEKKDEIARTGEQIAEYLGTSEAYRKDELPVIEDTERAVLYASRSFDQQHGGFGPAPKFPRSLDVSMLLRAYSRGGDGSVLAMCEITLEKMAYGGLYDQVGGGFHRYSTDAVWLVPHFEKMLYDNALLARTYLEAYQLTEKDLYRRIGKEVLDYVLREMTSPEGGFYSATDADSEGEEGAFFVWTPAEVEDVLGVADAKLFCAYFDVTASGNFEGKNILHVTRPLADVAAELGVDVESGERIVRDGRQKLYERRELREKPFRDEKVLTSWNGLMISAFAKGAQILSEDAYAQAAVRAADLILDKVSRDGRLLRVRKDGESKILGFLDDYAYFAESLVDLYETTFDRRFLDEARRLADFVVESFGDSEAGGFFYTATDHEKLIVRRKDPFDNATPAAGGVLAHVLLRLERLTGESRYRDHAEEYFRSVKGALTEVPLAFASTLIAQDFYLNPPVEIAIVGDLSSENVRGLVRAAQSCFLPSRVLAALDVTGDPHDDPELPLLRGKGEPGAPSRAYVCRNFACRSPVETPDALLEELRVAASRKG